MDFFLHWSQISLGCFLAVHGVAVLLGLLGTSLHLQLAYLLRLEVAVLLLNWEGEDVGELLAVPVDIGLAHLDLDLGEIIIKVELKEKTKPTFLGIL